MRPDSEQREDSIAGGLHDVTVVATGRVDHELQRRVDNRARLLRIEVLHQLRGALDVGEQRRDRLALAFEGTGVGDGLLRCDTNLGSGRCDRGLCRRGLRSDPRATFLAESGARLISGATGGTDRFELCAASSQNKASVLLSWLQDGQRIWSPVAPVTTTPRAEDGNIPGALAGAAG